MKTFMKTFQESVTDKADLPSFASTTHTTKLTRSM